VTPIDANQAIVSSTVNVRSTFAMALRLPLKSSAVTASCVTLQRPPPEMRIFAPIFGAPSRATMRAAGASRRAKIAAVSPAAPAPMIAISYSSL
jgi:hypothetical protein